MCALAAAQVLAVPTTAAVHYTATSDARPKCRGACGADESCACLPCVPGITVLRSHRRINCVVELRASAVHAHRSQACLQYEPRPRRRRRRGRRAWLQRRRAGRGAVPVDALGDGAEAVACRVEEHPMLRNLFYPSRRHHTLLGRRLGVTCQPVDADGAAVMLLTPRVTWRRHHFHVGRSDSLHVTQEASRVGDRACPPR